MVLAPLPAPPTTSSPPLVTVAPVTAKRLLQLLAALPTLLVPPRRSQTVPLATLRVLLEEPLPEGGGGTFYVERGTLKRLLLIYAMFVPIALALSFSIVTIVAIAAILGIFIVARNIFRELEPVD